MSKSDWSGNTSFAARYADPHFSYLSAYIALERAEELIADAENLQEIVDESTISSRPLLGAEITSYYAVGFVTCLEWHARSRLVDLIIFDPTVDVKKFSVNINSQNLMEMIGKRVSLAHVVGSMVNVSSLSRYIEIFSLLFDKLNIELSFGRLLTEDNVYIKEPVLTRDEINKINELFNFRNSLVHEVGVNVIGPYVLRQNILLSEAIELGSKVLSLMKGVEEALIGRLPEKFPNRLTSEFNPVSREEYLMAEVLRLEELASKEIASENWSSSDTYCVWTRSQKSFWDFWRDQEKFIDEGEMFRTRHSEGGGGLKIDVLEGRIEYIRKVLDTFTSVHRIRSDDKFLRSGGLEDAPD